MSLAGCILDKLIYSECSSIRWHNINNETEELRDAQKKNEGKNSDTMKKQTKQNRAPLFHEVTFGTTYKNHCMHQQYGFTNAQNIFSVSALIVLIDSIWKIHIWSTASKKWNITLDQQVA